MREQTLIPIAPTLRLITAFVLLTVAVTLFLSQQAIVLNKKASEQAARAKTAVKQQLPRFRQAVPVWRVARCQETAC